MMSWMILFDVDAFVVDAAVVVVFDAAAVVVDAAVVDAAVVVVVDTVVVVVDTFRLIWKLKNFVKK